MSKPRPTHSTVTNFPSDLILGCLAIVFSIPLFYLGAETVQRSNVEETAKAPSLFQFPTLQPQAPQAEGIGETVAQEVVALRRAIIGQESAGNFRAVNPHSGALGYGQVMEFNLPSWTQEALGRQVGRAEFLSNPDIQIKVIDHKLNQYWEDALAAAGGDHSVAVRRVAAQWYSGNPNLYVSTRTQYYNGHRYPSIADYTISVLRRFHQMLG